MIFPLFGEKVLHGRRLARTLIVAAAAAIGLSACGLDAGQEAPAADAITDPVVAATVDGRAIYFQEVRQRADQICAETGSTAHLGSLCALAPGEDVESRPELFNMALDQLIQQRLFAGEAERRGLDRDPEVRRQLELARERVLADAVYRDLYERASEPERVATEYRNVERQLSGRPLVTISHILLPTREAALAAQRRLTSGEPFESLASELSLDEQSGKSGGFLGEMAADTLPPAFRDLVTTLDAGSVGGPLRSEDGWHLIRVHSRSASQAPSLESQRPDIVNYLLSQEVDALYARLAEDAQIRTISEQDREAAGESDAAPPPAAAPEARPAPMGPGALAGGSDTASSTLPSAGAGGAAAVSPPTSRPATPAAGPAATQRPTGQAVAPPRLQTPNPAPPPSSSPSATPGPAASEPIPAAPPAAAPVENPAGPTQ